LVHVGLGEWLAFDGFIQCILETSKYHLMFDGLYKFGGNVGVLCLYFSDLVVRGLLCLNIF